MSFIEAALSAGPREAERTLLILLRFAVLARIGDERSRQAAMDAAAAEVQDAARTEAAYRIQLAALRQVLEGGADDRLVTQVDQALRTAPDVLLPELLMMKGEVLGRLARSPRDYMRAAWPYLRVAVHFPNHELVPRALLCAAEALERAELPDKALALVEESVGHARANAADRDEARRRADSLRRTLHRAADGP